MIKKKVVILGAGVGGLTTAHYLSKNPLFDITIYERKDEIGGMARSDRDQDGCAREYCWRVFFNFYSNLFEILDEIPLYDNLGKPLGKPLHKQPKNNQNNNLVSDNFTIYRHNSFSDTPMTIKDKWSLLYNVLYGSTSCDARLNDLDNLTWWDAMHTSSKSNLFREIGPWLGMDRYKGSYKSVIKVGMEMNYNHFIGSIIGVNSPDYITNKPTSEAVFYHWYHFLKDKGVNIHTNHEIVSIEINNNKVNSVKIFNKLTNQYKTIIADIFVLGLPIEVLSSLVKNNKSLQKSSLSKMPKLKEISLHKQLSFQLYFDRSISLGKMVIPDYDNCNNNDNYNKSEFNAFLLVDSPWDLIVLQYDKCYEDTELCKNLPNVKGGWSIAVCTSYINGILYNKPFEECNFKEATDEIWMQLMNSKTLRKHIREHNNFDLRESMIIKWAPRWDTYYNDKKGKLVTREPKFTNNAGTWALRPSYKTSIDNLYVSTAYVKETIDIFSMEAAAIAGKLVSKSIYDRINIKFPSFIDLHTNRPSYTLPFIYLDTIMYSINGPNIGVHVMVVCVLIVVVFLLYLFYKMIKNNKKIEI